MAYTKGVDDTVSNGPVQSTTDAVAQGLYEQSADQMGPIGARRVLDDGRVFRYAKFTAGAVAAGCLVAQDATSQFVAETAATTVRNSAGSAADIASSDNVTRLYFLDTDKFTAAQSNDVLAGGYCHFINSATGGYTYRIRKNTYAAATSIMTIDLYDPIVENITSESEMAVTGNLFYNVAIANNGSDDAVSGVTVINVTASYYAWVQTWGIATVLADKSAGTIARGTIATLSDGVNGAAQPIAGGATQTSSLDSSFGAMSTEPVIGFFLDAATDANYTPVFLQLGI